MLRHGFIFFYAYILAQLLIDLKADVDVRNLRQNSAGCMALERNDTATIKVGAYIIHEVCTFVYVFAAVTADLLLFNHILAFFDGL